MEGIYEWISEAQLKNYAQLAVQAGVNLQKNQRLIIHSDIQNAAFARLIQTAAYEGGASSVFIDWTDEQSTREFYLNAADRVIDHFPDWQAVRFKEWDDAGAAYIHIISENTDIFKEVAPERISRFQKASRTKLEDHYAKIMSHKVRWCLVAVPSFAWAAKCFRTFIKKKPCNRCGRPFYVDPGQEGWILSKLEKS